MRPPQIPPALPVDDGDREISRILALPWRIPVEVDRDRKTGLYAPEAEALADVETARYSLGGVAPAHDPGRAPGKCGCAGLGFPCVTRLYPSQAWFLRELRQSGGALGFQTVAAGKTFCMLLAALAVNCRHAILFIKPDQKHHYKLNYLRLREHFRVPSLVFHDGPVGDFRGTMIPDVPVVRVIPYSRLSRPEASALLVEDLADVDAVFGDEAHCFSDRTSRRTARVLKFLAARRGHVSCAFVSGSLIKKTIEDVSHLALFALGGGSPYPLDQKVAVPAWGAVIDPVRDPDLTSSTYRSLEAAFAGSADKVRDGVDNLFGGSVNAIRDGILRRVVHTPGVISTKVSEATASITLSEFKVPALPERLRKMVADVRQRWVRPDGEELQEKVEVVGCAKNLAVGFYYYWHFRNEPDFALREAWFAARKAWCKEVREKIREDVSHLDSPFLLENAAKRACQNPPYKGPLPVWHSRTWAAWAEVKDLISYEPRSEWVDDFFAEACAEWARKNDHAIVWFESVPLGERIAKISGLPLHRGGPRAEERILGERGDKAIIASVSAHREGRDGLQYYFHRGLVAEPLSSGDGWHQLFGRYCRPGQSEDTVEICVPLHTEEFRGALRNAHRYATFDAQMSPNRQLLLAADPDAAVAACIEDRS